MTTTEGGAGYWIYLVEVEAEGYFGYIIDFVHATQSEQNRDVYTFDETLPEGLLYIDFNASVVENIQNGYYTIRSSDNASQVECRVTDGTLDLEDVFGTDLDRSVYYLLASD